MIDEHKWRQGLSFPYIMKDTMGKRRYINEYDNWENIKHNPDWHPEGKHTLRCHIEAAMDMAQEISGGLNFPFINLLFDCVLFHDIGKPSTRKMNEKTGFNSFIMHEKIGAEIFREKYAHLFDKEAADVIEWCIREHTNWWNVMKHGKSLAIREHPAYELLSYLCLSDKMGYKNKEWTERRAHFENVRGVSDE